MRMVSNYDFLICAGKKSCSGSGLLVATAWLSFQRLMIVIGRRIRMVMRNARILVLNREPLHPSLFCLALSEPPNSSKQKEQEATATGEQSWG